MSSGYCTKLGTEHCSIIRIVLCGTTFTLLKKRCQCFVDAPMLRSHRRQRPLTDNKEKPQPHCRRQRHRFVGRRFARRRDGRATCCSSVLSSRNVTCRRVCSVASLRMFSACSSLRCDLVLRILVPFGVCTM